MKLLEETSEEEMKEEYAIYIKPLYENWSVEEAKENIRKAQEENEDILEEITKRIIEAETENEKLKQDKQEFISWLKEKIETLEICKKVNGGERLKQVIDEMYYYNRILEKLGE